MQGPIRNSRNFRFFNKLNDIKIITLVEYERVWREWLNFSKHKSLVGLDNFKIADYTQGTSQSFDNFILRHSKDREILVLSGDFPLIRLSGKHVEFKYVDYSIYLEGTLQGPGLHALLISAIL